MHAQHEKLVRSLINLGRMPVEGTAPTNILPWATNAKLSDVAGAFLAQHLTRMPQLSGLCRAQYARVAAFGRAAGFRLLSGTEEFTGTPAVVVLLASRPIDDIGNSFVRLAKHYRPLAETPVAAELFSHIVIVPCHPDIAKLSDHELRQCFLELEAHSR